MCRKLILFRQHGRDPVIISKFVSHKSESESLTLRQCNAFTDDVPPFGLFIEQLEIFLVTTSDIGISIIFYTLSRNSSIFTLYFP